MHWLRPCSPGVVYRLAVLGFFAAALGLTGCGVSAKVNGKVTCDGKPVTGMIQFSPKGDSPDNTGATVVAQLKDDGSYEMTLKSIGPHTVIVLPSDLKIVGPGTPDHHCDRTPQEVDVKSGENTIPIALKARTP